MANVRMNSCFSSFSDRRKMQSELSGNEQAEIRLVVNGLCADHKIVVIDAYAAVVLPTKYRPFAKKMVMRNHIMYSITVDTPDARMHTIVL